MNNLNLDWQNLGFDYRQTAKRYVSNYENGAWDEGILIGIQMGKIEALKGWIKVIAEAQVKVSQ